MALQVGRKEPSEERWPEDGTAFWYPVRGGSMSPALLEGDEVLLMRMAQPAARGQVVVVRDAEGRFVLHRVVAVRQDEIITRGDACFRPDPAVPTQSILLKAVRRRRAGQESPIPAPGWRPLRRLRWRLRRFLSLLARAPGRSWKAKRSSSTSTDTR